MVERTKRVCNGKCLSAALSRGEATLGSPLSSLLTLVYAFVWIVRSDRPEGHLGRANLQARLPEDSNLKTTHQASHQ